jgi:hypothetical protein
LQTERGNDVSFFPVLVLQERQPGGAAGIIFDGDDLGLDAVLAPLEIDVADFLLLALADAPAGDSPVAVAPAGLLAGEDQPLLGLGLGDVVERRDGDIARRGGQGSETFDGQNQASLK